MADISDVQNALAGLIAGWLYPTGASGMSPVVGFTVRVGSGWPTSVQLDTDLKNGVANVSAYGTNTERKTTRWLTSEQQLSSRAPTLTLTASGRTVTVGGTNPAPYSQQNVAVFVDGLPYTYPVQPTDTPVTVAAALAVLIPGASSAGAVLTVPVGVKLGAVRVGGTGTSVRVIRSQNRLVQIALWCSTPAQRTALSNVIDPMLSDMRFLTMPDGLYARVVYHDSPQKDLGEKERLFRKDIRFYVDFATTKTKGTAQVIVGNLIVSDQSGNLIKHITV